MMALGKWVNFSLYMHGSKLGHSVPQSRAANSLSGASRESFAQISIEHRSAPTRRSGPGGVDGAFDWTASIIDGWVPDRNVDECSSIINVKKRPAEASVKGDIQTSKSERVFNKGV